MKNALIDIIIPNRNKASFLPATLASLANQTEQRWHATIIDGESTDGSQEILRAAATRDPRITLLIARPPSTTGQSFYRSWNQGLLHVRAPYFAILTSDDLWEPEWISRATSALENAPSAVAIAARAIVMDAAGQIGGPTAACRQLEASFDLHGAGIRTLPWRECTLRGLTLGPLFSTIHSLVFRRRILEEGGLFSEDVGVAADIEYYLHTCLLGDILYDLDTRALFRVYPEQASGQTQGAMITEQWMKIVTRNRDFVAERLGISAEALAKATDEILARHLFLMVKPSRANLERSKYGAALNLLKAGLASPRLLYAYLQCRSSFDRFYTQTVTRLTKQLERTIPAEPLRVQVAIT